MTAPLWDLTKQEPDLRWNAKSVRAFEIIRSEIANVTYSSYLDRTKSLIDQTDASGIGVGEVVLQEGTTITFASRCLTAVEK